MMLETMRTESVTDNDSWIPRLESSAIFDDGGLAARLERLKTRRAVSLHVLSAPVLGALVDAAEALPFRSARYEVGKPEARVYQEFDYCGAVPGGHPFHGLARWFEARLKRALRRMAEPPVDLDFTINDVVCQHYRPGDLGITPHRDHIAYTGLVVLLVLDGHGRFFVCDDRRGGNQREIDAAPGRVILMPGPGYAGRRDRPFHMVRDITSRRYSVGLRHDARIEA